MSKLIGLWPMRQDNPLAAPVDAVGSFGNRVETRRFARACPCPQGATDAAALAGDSGPLARKSACATRPEHGAVRVLGL